MCTVVYEILDHNPCKTRFAVSWLTPSEEEGASQSPSRVFECVEISAGVNTTKSSGSTGSRPFDACSRSSGRASRGRTTLVRLSGGRGACSIWAEGDDFFSDEGAEV